MAGQLDGGGAGRKTLERRKRWGWGEKIRWENQKNSETRYREVLREESRSGNVE